MSSLPPSSSSSSSPPLLLYVSGDSSGVGKSSICLGFLGYLLKSGYSPSDLAYIKPCTQCEDIQLISKWCEEKGVAHQGIGPVRFYQGFTGECIRGEDEGIEKRHDKIMKAIRNISKDKKIVIVDGVGYPSVGSCAGVSNAHVASLLGIPVLVVGRPGSGNAIDSFNMIRAYFSSLSVSLLGAVFNNIPKKVSYHTYESCKENVSLYFKNNFSSSSSSSLSPSSSSLSPPSSSLSPPSSSLSPSSSSPSPSSSPSSSLSFSYYGSVLQNEKQHEYRLKQKEITGGVACVLRETKENLEYEEGEREVAEGIVEWMAKYVDYELLVKDMEKYYQNNTHNV